MISIVVPVFNEEESVAPLMAEIASAARMLPVGEVIFVDDASTDKTSAAIEALKREHPIIRLIRHPQNCGQSASLWTGVKGARFELIVTMDGDGQNNPHDMARLYQAFEQSHLQRLIVLGEREKRNDPWIKRISSRIANSIRRKLLRDGTRDTGCSLKLFRREDFLALPYFDHMHRFLPALMMWNGVALQHVSVSHRPRLRGQSKYNTLQRLSVGIVDLAGVMWLRARSRRTFDAIEETAAGQVEP